VLFSSHIFLFLFLPITLAGYFLLHKSYRNLFLLVMSLGFYAWGEPRFVLVMAASILFNYVSGLLVGRFRQRQALAKCLLGLCLAGNLGLLFIYKYADFVIGNLNRFGLGLPLTNLVLPLGISFFTFQAMSYVIDVYRGTVQAQPKLQNVSLYIAFFPQLIAGPIVRYKDIEAQIEDREIRFDEFSEGIKRFIIGFSKKILLANQMAVIADRAFAMPDAERSIVYAWLGAIAYSLQLLFDFAGYSDMAIGLGKMFGFRFMENFNYPYISKSIIEFWRRWHISLGQWFRDYVYFPMGGSRVKGVGRLVFNIFIVWFLTGVWHGANWTYVVWGLLNFVLIAFERLSGYPDKFKTAPAKEAYRVFMLVWVLFGMMVVRSANITAAYTYGLSMLGLQGNSLFCDNVIWAFREHWLFLAAAILCSTELIKRLSERLQKAGSILRGAAGTAAIGFYMFCLVWSVSFIVLGAHNPFIYFNF